MPKLKGTGTVQIMQTHVMEHLMSIPGDAIGAIKELVDNSLDANATSVWVILGDESLTVLDDGHGMVPKMPDEDYEMLQLYKKELSQGLEPDDIRDLLNNPCAFASFTWAMECIGFSGKKRYLGNPTKTLQAKQGMRGIGALSFNLIGDEQVWDSKPQSELANSYYGEDVVRQGQVPLVRLRPPTRPDIKAHRIDYEFVELSGEERFLREPIGGTILPGGTRVKISHLLPEVDRVLTPENLSLRLKKLYGTMIREGHIKLLIVDKRGGKEDVVEVEGSHYEGALLLKATLRFKVSGKKIPFRAEIYYDERATNATVDLVRSGLSVNELTKLSEFAKQDPWNLGKLRGYVEFPSLPAFLEDRAWDTGKTALRDSRERRQWVEQISKEIAPKIRERIAEIADRAHSDALEEAFNQAKAATETAMREIPALMALDFIQPARPLRPRTKREKRPNRNVHISVIDENNIGVPDVTLEFYRERSLVVRRVTSLSGGTDFGRPGIGNYLVRAILPQNSGFYPQAGESLERAFSLVDVDQGYQNMIKVFTGRKKPERTNDKKAEFRLGSTTLDPEVPYSIDRLDNGLLLVNTEGDALKDALDRGDEQMRNILIAEYISAGITEWGLGAYPAGQQHLIRCQVFSKIITNLVAPKRRRRR